MTTTYACTSREWANQVWEFWVADSTGIVTHTMGKATQLRSTNSYKFSELPEAIQAELIKNATERGSLQLLQDICIYKKDAVG